MLEQFNNNSVQNYPQMNGFHLIDERFFFT